MAAGTTPAASTSVGVPLQGIALTSILVAAAVALFPHLRAEGTMLDASVFFGGAFAAMLGIARASRGTLSGRSALVLGVLAVTTLLTIASFPIRSPWAAVVVDTSLVAFAVGAGGSIGGRVQHAGHLLPACVVAACVDVASVLSPQGPSHAIAQSERALSVLAVSFPVPGTREIAPALGVGDLVFVALILGAVRAHQLPFARVLALVAAGIVAAGVGSAVTGGAFPALPAIGALVVIGTPQARRIQRKDRTVATIAMGAAIVVAAGVVARHRFG